MTRYDDVRVIKTGAIGMIIEVKDGRFLVDFGFVSEWYDECDLLPAPNKQ